MVTLLLSLSSPFIAIFIVHYTQSRISRREEAKLKLEKLEKLGESLNNASRLINRYINKFEQVSATDFSYNVVYDIKLLDESLALLHHAEHLEVLYFNYSDNDLVNNITKLITVTTLLSDIDHQKIRNYRKQIDTTYKILNKKNTSRIIKIRGDF